MRINALSLEEKKKIQIAYRRARHPTEKVRYLALKLLSQGYFHKEVSRILGVSDATLRDWVTIYNQGGLEGLREKRVTGNHRKLSVKQKEQLGKLLREKTPEQCGYEGRFWTVGLLQKLVQREYGITYRSDQSYRNLFQQAGFSFHKPGKVHKDQNPHMRKRFEQRLKKNSRSTGEKIVWYW